MNDILMYSMTNRKKCFFVMLWIKVQLWFLFWSLSDYKDNVRKFFIKGTVSPDQNWLKVISCDRPWQRHQMLAIKKRFNSFFYFLWALYQIHLNLSLLSWMWIVNDQADSKFTISHSRSWQSHASFMKVHSNALGAFIIWTVDIKSERYTLTEHRRQPSHPHDVTEIVNADQ